MISGSFEDGDVVGLIGDSITHATYTPVNYVEALYQYYLSRFPGRRIEFRNLSAAGYKVSDILSIYDQDPAFEGISKAVIMLGTNEAILGVSAEEYIANMGELVDRLKEDGLQGGDILIVSPPICDQDCAINLDKNGRRRWNFEGRLLEYLELLETKTREWGVGYVDLHTPMLALTRRLQEENPQNTLTTDCIHPDAAGQMFIAYHILQAQGAGDAALSEIFLPEDGPAQAVGGELADLYRGEKGLCWTWKPDRLLVPVTEGLEDFLGLVEDAGTLYRKELRVEGLSENAVYLVAMGEAELGSFTGKELGEGIDCAKLEKYPLREVMDRIEARSRERHREAVRYRNIWIEVMMRRNAYTPKQIQAEYENWRSADELLRNEIYALAQEAAGRTFFVSITEEGYSAEELRRDAERERKEAAERAQKDAEEQVRKDAEEQVRKDAEEQVRKDAEEQVRKDAEEQGQGEAENQTREEAENVGEIQGRRLVVGGVGAAVMLALAVVAVRVEMKKTQQSD